MKSSPSYLCRVGTRFSLTLYCSKHSTTTIDNSSEWRNDQGGKQPRGEAGRLCHYHITNAVLSNPGFVVVHQERGLVRTRRHVA